jgi:hypothetical protein
MKRALVTIASAILLASCGQPENPTWGINWARTPVSYGQYRVSFTSTKPHLVKDTGGNAVLFALPAQARFSCKTAASEVTACWSMAKTPTITAPGNFAVDGSSVYAAGPGSCATIQSPIPDFMGVSPGYFMPQTHGSYPPGARKYKCGSTLQPCTVDGDCSSGTCSTSARPDRAYRLVMSSTNTGSCDVMDAR